MSPYEICFFSSTKPNLYEMAVSMNLFNYFSSLTSSFGFLIFFIDSYLLSFSLQSTLASKR